MGVIGDVVGDRRRLRLEARVGCEAERLDSIVFEDRRRHAARPVTLGRRAGGGEERTVVLDEPGKGWLGEIQAVEFGVAALERGDDAQRMAVVVEAAMIGHAGVERILAGMAERGVAEVVAERDRLGEVVVNFERTRERPGDLSDLDRVGEPGAKVIALVMDEHLGFVREAAEGGRMDDPVAVALEFRAGLGRRLRDEARRARGIGRVGSGGGPPGLVRHPHSPELRFLPACIS